MAAKQGEEGESLLDIAILRSLLKKVVVQLFLARSAPINDDP
jgi:hypothetical protein